MDSVEPLRAATIELWTQMNEARQFGQFSQFVYFPLWFPAFIFAVGAVTSLKLNRFTIRSAIIATTVVAVLLGMAVRM